MEALPARPQFPPGVIALSLFWAIGLIGTLFASRNAVVFFGPVILEGLPATIYCLVSAGAICILIAGVLRRSPWIRNVTTIYYGTSVSVGLLTLVSFFWREAYFLDFFRARAPGAAEYVTPETVLAGLVLVNAAGLAVAVGIFFYMKRAAYFHGLTDERR